MGAFIYIYALLLHTALHACSYTHRTKHTDASAAGKKNNKTITHTLTNTQTHTGSREDAENALINYSGLTPSCTHLPTVLHAHVNNRMCSHADTYADARTAAYHHYVCTHTHVCSLKLLCFTHSHSIPLLSFFSNTLLRFTLHVRKKKTRHSHTIASVCAFEENKNNHVFGDVVQFGLKYMIEY